MHNAILIDPEKKTLTEIQITSHEEFCNLITSPENREAAKQAKKQQAEAEGYVAEPSDDELFTTTYLDHDARAKHKDDDLIIINNYDDEDEPSFYILGGSSDAYTGDNRRVDDPIHGRAVVTRGSGISIDDLAKRISFDPPSQEERLGMELREAIEHAKDATDNADRSNKAAAEILQKARALTITKKERGAWASFLDKYKIDKTKAKELFMSTTD